MSIIGWTLLMNSCFVPGIAFWVCCLRSHPKVWTRLKNQSNTGSSYNQSFVHLFICIISEFITIIPEFFPKHFLFIVLILFFNLNCKLNFFCEFCRITFQPLQKRTPSSTRTNICFLLFLPQQRIVIIDNCSNMFHSLFECA